MAHLWCHPPISYTDYLNSRSLWWDTVTWSSVLSLKWRLCQTFAEIGVLNSPAQNFLMLSMATSSSVMQMSLLTVSVSAWLSFFPAESLFSAQYQQFHAQLGACASSGVLKHLPKVFITPFILWWENAVIQMCSLCLMGSIGLIQQAVWY